MASLRPQKDALYAQKVIQVSKSDTRDLVAGTDQNGVSPDDRVIDLLSQQKMIFNQSGLSDICMLAPSLINKQPINGLFLTHHPPFAALPGLGM